MAIGGVVNPNAVANAYSSSQNISGQASIAKIGEEIKGAASNNEISASNNTPSFSELMAQNIEKSVDTMKSGEEMAAKAVTGDASITDIVQAVTAAELTLQTVVSVRDKMISAYKDIMRMPI